MEFDFGHELHDCEQCKNLDGGIEPMRESGCSSLSQPRYTAHAVVAGAVSERSPAKNPIRKAKRSVII